MTKKMKWSVEVQFKNYWGDITESVEVARFCSKERAEEYLSFMDNTDNQILYVIREL